MGFFERFLTVWVALAIMVGVGLGVWQPELFAGIAKLEIAHINLPVAVLIWLMIYPMMIQIGWSAIKDVGKKPKGLALTLFINWLVKPFTMASLSASEMMPSLASIVAWAMLPQISSAYIRQSN